MYCRIGNAAVMYRQILVRASCPSLYLSKAGAWANMTWDIEIQNSGEFSWFFVVQFSPGTYMEALGGFVCVPVRNLPFSLGN